MGVAPTDPGMPARHSSPAHPRATVASTNASHGSPAAAYTVPSSRNAVPRIAMRTTNPSKPASDTTTLEPPPSTASGSPCAADQLTARSTESSSAASSKYRAGPPSSSVVNRASGTPARRARAASLTRSPPRGPAPVEAARSLGDSPWAPRRPQRGNYHAHVGVPATPSMLTERAPSWTDACPSTTAGGPPGVGPVEPVDGRRHRTSCAANLAAFKRAPLAPPRLGRANRGHGGRRAPAGGAAAGGRRTDVPPRRRDRPRDRGGADRAGRLPLGVPAGVHRRAGSLRRHGPELDDGGPDQHARRDAPAGGPPRLIGAESPGLRAMSLREDAETFVKAMALLRTCSADGATSCAGYVPRPI